MDGRGGFRSLGEMRTWGQWVATNSPKAKSAQDTVPLSLFALLEGAGPMLLDAPNARGDFWPQSSPNPSASKSNQLHVVVFG